MFQLPLVKLVTFTLLFTIQLSTPYAAELCQGYGPQTPRDIEKSEGTNKQVFSPAPAYQQLNLCNIHFHSPAEHKASAFSVKHVDEGYQCNISASLSNAELKPMVNKNYCKNVNPGDTIEVHWVHSSCDVQPGKGLESCSSNRCLNPQLRVETQVFTLVNDPNALNFMEFAYQGNRVNGLHQAKALPVSDEKTVEFSGSTTGPQFTEQTCSPLQVSWHVRTPCVKLDINSLSQWCKSNAFEENEPHGVRPLVKSKALLSPIN